MFASSLRPLGHQKVVQNWIFTPSFSRANDVKQAFLNWSKAMDSDVEFIHVLVVRAAERADYEEVVAVMNSCCKPMQQTMIMTLPPKLSLKRLKGLSAAYKQATALADLNINGGIGYARLCIQLVATALQLPDVWMLDDNIQDCWQLDLDAESLHQPPHQHTLQPCSFGTIMRGVEFQVSNVMGNQGGDIGQAECGDQPPGAWDPEISPREPRVVRTPSHPVNTWFDYSGSHSHYAILGPSRQPHRYSLVGAKWPGGRGPPPFKITHSVYSFFLLNITATMGDKLVLRPAKQYAEDIEFHHLCEDNKLAVVKCNRFYFHKADLQGVEKPIVWVTPTHGPIWGGQLLQVHNASQMQTLGREPSPLPASTISMTVCGISAAVYNGRSAWSPPLLPEIPLLTTPQSNTVLTGSLEVLSANGLVASQQYTYHGLWRWSADVQIDIDTPDAGNPQATHALSEFLQTSRILYL